MPGKIRSSFNILNPKLFSSKKSPKKSPTQTQSNKSNKPKSSRYTLKSNSNSKPKTEHKTKIEPFHKEDKKPTEILDYLSNYESDTKINSTKLLDDIRKRNYKFDPKINSTNILYIIHTYKSKSRNLSNCPTEITKEMLVIELDCEDLRANLEKETKDSLWSAYREVNSHLFRDRPPPTKQDLKELQNLIDKIKESKESENTK
jgi:hypothetical protein